eukprot:CAMPEP_0117658626 /NCGR_PEP_ID=MMETSP0804-20121206/5964_1 /TAXON_ID=1074897 /ORGANISM="Tetraselmis astigmatica, Strain CCMP880" /LENGTH=109 /DNA_ID=CAMNT_0005465159 /DNA_START=686 /DNA_END=1016 /DNA_ORIENTATION=-
MQPGGSGEADANSSSLFAELCLEACAVQPAAPESESQGIAVAPVGLLSMEERPPRDARRCPLAPLEVRAAGAFIQGSEVFASPAGSAACHGIIDDPPSAFARPNALPKD